MARPGIAPAPIAEAQPRDRGRACVRCVMDEAADVRITFDAGGLCNHCRRYDELLSSRVLQGAAGADALQALVREMKRQGRGREYDCIVGVSGGTDSTYAALLVKDLGLRALAVHLDNGWDSELAAQNIEHTVRQLAMDLYTHVIDWDEFRRLQVAFLRASVPDGEVPTDHAISALLWGEAARRGIRYVISGMNFTTESTSVPDWAYGHSDWRYIRHVHRAFGAGSLASFPRFSLARLLWWNGIRRLRTVSILNYVEYDKDTVVQELEARLGWRRYGGKHHESVYTRFYQGYLLPRKFGIDKRYGHLSDLINAGQTTREEALRELARPPYPPEQQAADLDYVIKKLRLSRAEFDAIMAEPARSFREFRNSYGRVQFLRRMVNRLRAAGWYPR